MPQLAKESSSGSLAANIAEDPGVLGFGGCPYKRKVAGNRKGEGFWSRKKEKQRLKARKREKERKEARPWGLGKQKGKTKRRASAEVRKEGKGRAR